MANHTPAETTQWVADTLREAKAVSKIDLLYEQILRVTRTKHDPFVVGIVSVLRVEADHIMPLVESKHRVEIIINVPKEAVWTGGAIRRAQESSIATGTFGDFYRVLGEPSVRGFLPSESAFIERGLRQHDRVAEFERVYDKVYRVSRKGGLADLTAAMLNEYELTADHIRTARDRYGKFDVAVNTNPNGTITDSALDAAKSMGIEMLKWGPFFGRLNTK